MENRWHKICCICQWWVLHTSRKMSVIPKIYTSARVGSLFCHQSCVILRWTARMDQMNSVALMVGHTMCSYLFVQCKMADEHWLHFSEFLNISLYTVWRMFMGHHIYAVVESCCNVLVLWKSHPVIMHSESILKDIYTRSFYFTDDGSCGDKSFTCNDKTCVSISSYCDFQEDCLDGSDEMDCSKVPDFCPLFTIY